MNIVNEKLKTSIVKINIDSETGCFEILDFDKNNVLKIIKTFPDGINNNDISLTPQLWWGNLNDPQIVILGLNPSCRYGQNGDFVYNKTDASFKKILGKNLLFFNRDESLKLGEMFKNYKKVSVIKTWSEEYCLNQSDFDLNQVAIYNMFGYYQTNLVNRDVSLSHIKDEIKIDIIKKIKNAKKVYFLWKGTKNLWIKLLCDNDDKVLKEILEKAISANEYNSRKPSFKNI